MLAGYDVAYSETFTGTQDCTASAPCTTTKYLVGNGTSQSTQEGNSSWLGWIFIIMAIFSVMLFFMAMMA